MTSSVSVDIQKGKVSGILENSKFSGVEFYTFYGIPYAEPPIGDLRFKDPVEVKPWKSIRDCTKQRGGPLQFSMKDYRFCGSEDCLYVNVHTPELICENDPLKPVIALIHPGGYKWGSPDPDHNGSPDFIMHHDIVYVTIGHRLGALGFLNLGLQECSGNQGLKDVIMGLQWIHSNIHFFGGDAKNITLYGSSSGGSLIHFLMLSPAVRGLYHKVVLTCGYIFNPVALIMEDAPLKNAYSFGEALGYRRKSPKGLLQFLKKQPAEILQTYINDFNRRLLENTVIAFPLDAFGPSIDRGKNAVLPRSPRELIPDMECMPLIFGICEHETVIAFTKYNRKVTDANLRTAYVQNCWAWTHGLSTDEVDFMYQKIESFYMKNIDNETHLFRAKNDLLSDAAYSDVYETLIDVISSKLPSSVFLYRFEYVGEINALKNQIDSSFSESLRGTFHADDFSYWSMMSQVKNDQTKQMIHTYTKLITTFARTGNPNHKDLPVEWRPSSPSTPCYLRLDQTLEMVDGLFNGQRMEFWHDLKKQLKGDKTI